MQVRNTMRSGPERTRRMSSIVRRVGETSPGSDHLQSIRRLHSGTEGERLIAIALLEAQPDPAYFDVVLESIANPRSAFEQYHAIKVAEHMVDRLSPEHKDQLEQQLRARLQDEGFIGTDRALLTGAIMSRLTGAPRASAKLWRNGSTITVAFLDGDLELQRKVVNVAKRWTEYANLVFEFGVEPARASIRISFQQAGSWSFVGTDALVVPSNQPTMNFGDLTLDMQPNEIEPVVLRQFGHALGLVNEHQISNADIHWDRETVYRVYTQPPHSLSKEQIDIQFFVKLKPDYYPIEKEFDPDSVMLLPIPGELMKNRITVGPNTTLSDGDKDFIRALYPSNSE